MVMRKRKCIFGSFLIIAAMLLNGCGSHSEPVTSAADVKAESESANSSENERPQKIIVGCLAREEPDVMFVSEKLKNLGYDIEPQVFSDVITTNMALEEGEIDANFIQNRNYLNEFNKSKETHLVAPGVALTTSPEGIYSRKYKSLEDVPDGAEFAISNDAVNRARELELMQVAGLLELKEGIPLPTINDIVSNPKDLKIIEMESRSKWGAFDDVDCITITAISVYLMDDVNKPANLLAVEDLDVTKKVAGTLLVVHESNQEAEWLKEMEKVMTSDDFAKHLLETYNGAKVPMFDTDVFATK